MMNWLYYLLEANLYLAVFYGFYKLVLQRETFYSLSRFYLVFTSLPAFILPCIQLSGMRPAPGLQTQYVATVNNIVNDVPLKAEAVVWTASSVCALCYLAVSLFFITRLIINLYSLFRLIKKYPVQS